MTNCRNCGAPFNPEMAQCSYCGTYHHGPPAGDKVTLHLDGSKVAAMVGASILTPNEARGLLGLRSPSRLTYKED